MGVGGETGATRDCELCVVTAPTWQTLSSTLPALLWSFDCIALRDQLLAIAHRGLD